MSSLKSFFKKPVSILLIVILLLVALANLGFAAQNTVNTTSAGEGSTTVSGWTVATDVELLSGDPSTIDYIELTFSGGSGDPDNAWIEFRGTPYTCTLVGATATCDITGGLPVYDGTNATDSLVVIADVDSIP